MKNLSSDIEIALNNALNGLTKDINLLEFSDEKLERLVKSRQDSFSSVKEMLGIWQNSPNAPREDKLVKYTQKLIQAGNTSARILRDALTKDIDFDKLDPEKHGAAIRSLPIIYRAINEIDSGIKILERQIESKNS